MTPGKIVIDVPELRLDPERMQQAVDWAEVFGTSDDWSPDGPIEIEIGIGKGRFLLAAAKGRPHVRHLGVEWANKYLRFAEIRSVRQNPSSSPRRSLPKPNRPIYLLPSFTRTRRPPE